MKEGLSEEVVPKLWSENRDVSKATNACSHMRKSLIFFCIVDLKFLLLPCSLSVSDNSVKYNFFFSSEPQFVYFPNTSQLLYKVIS